MIQIERPKPRQKEETRIRHAVDILRHGGVEPGHNAAEGAALLGTVLGGKDSSPDGRAAASFHLGNLLSSIGRVAEAVDCFRRATDLAPGWPEARFNLGVALHNWGQHQDAVESLTRALEILEDLPPDNQVNRYLLGRIHYYLGLSLVSLERPQEAIDHLRTACELLEQDRNDPASSRLAMDARKAMNTLAE